MESVRKEIATVRRKVAYKKMIAEEAGLDSLLLRAYHRSIRYYPRWIKNPKDEKYVYPEVTDATEKITKDQAGGTFVTEFSIRNRKYTIVSLRKGALLAQSVYYIVELFINGKKSFAVSEKHDLRLKNEHYYTLNIEAYINEDWVDDFRKINEHWEKIVAATELEPSEEDVELVSRLKKDFNIGGIESSWSRRRSKLFLFQVLPLLIILLLTALIAFMAVSGLFRQ